MRKYRTETQHVEILESVQCDVCKKEFDVEADIWDAQEVLNITELWGYGAMNFGDLTEMEIDICEPCAYKMFAPYARLTDRMSEFIQEAKDREVVFIPMEDDEDLDIYQR